MDEVGSYGRQIGQISDALDVLLRHVPLENLSRHERDALTDFRLQLEQVNRLIEKRGQKKLPRAARVGELVTLMARSCRPAAMRWRSRSAL